ncbi:MAG TPA: hypothetical protein VFX92_08510 [Candidatus Krumholzibacteria bacterium]|nr:hypothetical protein [Candidatus Krumholzibacteria bacterium]
MSPAARKKPAAAPRRAARSGGSFPPALVLALLTFVVCCACLAPYMPDDSFISFRYAEHLADGHGLAFNIGERPVEAYSNLLWILLCALFYKAGMSLPQVTPYAGVLAGMACVVVLWTLVRRRAPLWTQQLPPMLLFAGFGPFVLYAVSGMETALFALLLLLVVRTGEDVIAHPGAKGMAAFTVAGFLASLTRPEGVLVFPVAAALAFWELRAADRLRAARRTLGVAAAAFVVATVAYHAWRVAYFGEWLPTPFLSKGAEGAGLLSGWRMNLSSYFINWTYYYPPQGYAFVALALLGFAGLHARVVSGERASGDRLAVALALVLGMVYANFVDWMPAMRYHVALAGLLIIPVASLHALLPAAAWTAASGARAGRFAALVLVLLLGGALGLTHLKMVTRKMTESADLCSRPLATWLRGNFPPDALLAIGDVGMVPYYSGLRTLDIHPQSLTDSYIAKRDFSADYVMTRHPDVIALPVRGVYSARMDPLHFQMYKMETFRLRYLFVGTVRQQWYEDRAYWIFVRRDLPVPVDRLKALPAGIGKQHRSGLES